MSQKWVVLDMRSVQDQPYSGIARFTRGLASGLLECVASSAFGPDGVRVILLGYEGLVESGQIDGILSRGIGSVRGIWIQCFPRIGLAPRKPRFLWANRVLGLLCSSHSELTAQPITWVAPDNIDGPFLSRMPAHVRVVQIIHDLIPITESRRLWSPLSLQMRVLSPRRVRKGQSLATVSRLSASGLAQFFGGVADEFPLIRPQLEPNFWIDAADVGDRAGERQRLFEALESVGCAQGEGPGSTGVGTVRFQNPRLFLGVGRDEGYKRWRFAAGSAQTLTRQKLDTWFLFVGKGLGTGGRPSFVSSQSRARSVEWCGFEAQIYLEDRVIHLCGIPDHFLMVLYRCADLLIHPSTIEGFGYTLAEAYVAGLPLVAGEHCGFWEAIRSLHPGAEEWPASKLAREFGLACLASRRDETFEDWFQALSEALMAGLLVDHREQGLRRLERLGNPSVRSEFCDWSASAGNLLKH